MQRSLAFALLDFWEQSDRRKRLANYMDLEGFNQAMSDLARAAKQVVYISNMRHILGIPTPWENEGLEQWP